MPKAPTKGRKPKPAAKRLDQPLTVMLTPPQMKRLRSKARKEGRSIADVTREALDAHLKG